MRAYGCIRQQWEPNIRARGGRPVQPHSREGRAAERGSICKNGDRIMTTFTTSVQILMHHLRDISDDAANICHMNVMGPE